MESSESFKVQLSPFSFSVLFNQARTHPPTVKMLGLDLRNLPITNQIKTEQYYITFPKIKRVFN
jgi:hypothetical protein